MQLAPPLVSRHLRVRREVGLAEVRGAGRQRLYRVNGQARKPLHEWVSASAALWEERFTAMDDVLAALTTEETGDGDH